MKLSPTLETIANHDQVMRIDYVQAFYRLTEVCREFAGFKLPQFIFELRNSRE